MTQQRQDARPSLPNANANVFLSCSCTGTHRTCSAGNILMPQRDYSQRRPTYLRGNTLQRANGSIAPTLVLSQSLLQATHASHVVAPLSTHGQRSEVFHRAAICQRRCCDMRAVHTDNASTCPPLKGGMTLCETKRTAPTDPAQRECRRRAEARAAPWRIGLYPFQRLVQCLSPVPIGLASAMLVPPPGNQFHLAPTLPSIRPGTQTTVHVAPNGMGALAPPRILSGPLLHVGSPEFGIVEHN